ncbi:MAG: hypothetical protein IJ727_11455 [Treponema sp.]|nr:hypothetical protein [Treponema sp.]
MNFWTWDKSEYIQEKLKQGKSIGKPHIKENYNRIKNDWLPFFKDKLLGEITRQDLRDFSAAIQKRDIANSTKIRFGLPEHRL